MVHRRIAPLVASSALAALAAVAGCGRGGDARSATGGVNDTLPAQTGATPATQAAAARPESFEQFWASFRRAVLAGDKEWIVSVTHFPFETRGESDDDPVRKHDRAAFRAMLDRLLDLDAGEGLEPQTMRQFVARATTLPPRTAAADAVAGVGTYEFAKINGRWRFTRAYITE